MSRPRVCVQVTEAMDETTCRFPKVQAMTDGPRHVKSRLFNDLEAVRDVGILAMFHHVLGCHGTNVLQSLGMALEIFGKTSVVVPSISWK